MLLRVKEQRNILQTIRRRRAKWIGHILRRNCLIRHFIEGEVVGRINYLAKFTTNFLLSYLAKFTTNVLLSYLAKFTTISC